MRDIIRVMPGNEPSRRIKAIKRGYEQFEARCMRLRALDYAYDTGQIAGREQAVVVNDCKVISDTKSSFIAGIPPQYTCDESDENAKAVLELFAEQSKPQLDQTITSWDSRLGLDHEMVYLRETKEGGLEPNSVNVSALDGFVAYDFSLDPDSVYGAIRYREVDDDGVESIFLDVYDDREVVRYALSTKDKGGNWTEVPGTRRPHGFDRVPLIEYRNNPDLRGDFECVLSLQAAINEVISDRVADKSKFASAVLVGHGVAFGDTDEEVGDMMDAIKDEKVLSVPRDATLEYLTKTFDESSVQILVDYLDNQLHKVSGIPDLRAESFAGNASGVAAQYYTLSMEDLAQAFVAQFQKGFMRRCKLYAYAMFGSADAVDVKSMKVVFKFNMPADVQYDANTMQIYLSNGAMSKLTMIEHNPFVQDAQQELERIEKEAEESAERQRQAFDDGVMGRMEQDSEDEEAPEDEPEEDEE